MRLSGIRIKGLFGSSNEHIHLDPQFPTVLTGGNGTGKSTILKLVHAISCGDVVRMSEAPVEEFVLEFDSGPDVRLTRGEAREGASLRWGSRRFNLGNPSLLSDLPDWALAGLEQSEYEIGEVLSGLSELARAAGATYQEYRSARERLTEGSVDEQLRHRPDWFDELSTEFPTLFVSDQRLVAEARRPSQRGGGGTRSVSPKNTRLAVEVASADLASRIREADSAYARASQQADRRLPNQILKAMTSGGEPTEAELNELIVKAEARRDDLKLVGLLDIGNYERELRPGSLSDPNVRRVMREVLRSTIAKLTVLDELESRLTSFKAFLDQRFSIKSVVLDRHEGTKFRLANGEVVRPRQLSSGEQQMMVLAYEILFKSSEGTLIIVDEPELSLHMLWQDSLIEDLQRMSAASDVHFLMATHSPMILAGHPDLERPLGTTA